MAEMSGKHALAELLRQEGVEYIFGNPGTTELPLMDVLAQRDDLQYILSLHEGVALAMAAGYAEASGKIGVSNFHVAPGLGNALGLIYTASDGTDPTAGDGRSTRSADAIGRALAVGRSRADGTALYQMVL